MVKMVRAMAKMYRKLDKQQKHGLTCGGNLRKGAQPVRYGGKQKKIKSPEDLRRIVSGYIQHVNELNPWLHGGDVDRPVFPSRDSFQEYAGISAQCLSDYVTNKDDRYNGYAEELKKLVSFRENFLNQLVMADPKRYTTIAIFFLKQPMFGGYVDKPTVQVEARELTIKTGEGMPKGTFE